MREEKERIEREEMLARARELHKEQREKEEETATDRLENGLVSVRGSSWSSLIFLWANGGVGGVQMILFLLQSALNVLGSCSI